MSNIVNAERVHIGIFGLRNVGKSSLINSLTNQNIAIVSDVAGTTTDPVKKSMELLPIGPVVIIDTPGLDDEGELGLLRVKKAKQVLNYIDLAIVVRDIERINLRKEEEIINLIKSKNVPYIVVYNKIDRYNPVNELVLSENEYVVSAKTGEGIEKLKDDIGKVLKKATEKRIVQDLVKENDTVVLVIPIDAGAPKGRIILPQQQVLRELVDKQVSVVIASPENLSSTLEKLNKKPDLVITDSQVFGKVDKIVSEDILLTSFSILFMIVTIFSIGYVFYINNNGIIVLEYSLDKLEDSSIVLISEGCTHHRQCEDIGTVKMPKWIKEYTGKDINFEFTSGGEFPEDLSKYDLIVHCGGCMINEREMHYRLAQANDSECNITNYGMTIAKIHGILERSLKPFKEMEKYL